MDGVTIRNMSEREPGRLDNNMKKELIIYINTTESLIFSSACT